MSRKTSKTTPAEAIFASLEKGMGRFLDLIFKKNQFEVFGHAEITRIWADIEALDPKLAVIEADKLADTVLKRAGLKGDSMAERLRRCEKLINRNAYQGMWEAHKVRNELVHEVGSNFRASASADCLGKIKTFLINLGAFGK